MAVCIPALGRVAVLASLLAQCGVECRGPKLRRGAVTDE